MSSSLKDVVSLPGGGDSADEDVCVGDETRPAGDTSFPPEEDHPQRAEGEAQRAGDHAGDPMDAGDCCSSAPDSKNGYEGEVVSALRQAEERQPPGAMSGGGEGTASGQAAGAVAATAPDSSGRTPTVRT